MISHSGEKPTVCQQCSNNFCQSVYLKAHMRTHIDGKPYACKQCDKNFTQFSNLKIHIRSYCGQKPFFCQQCGKIVCQFYGLNAHMITLSRERPYVCVTWVSLKLKLKAHVMTHNKKIHVNNVTRAIPNRFIWRHIWWYTVGRSLIMITIAQEFL